MVAERTCTFVANIIPSSISWPDYFYMFLPWNTFVKFY